VTVQDPKALGMVLAMIVDPAGKPVRGGSAKGQLYVSPDEVVVIRQTHRAELMNRVATALLVGSIAAVLVNIVTWKSPLVLWAAIAAQGAYWLLMPARRRALATRELSAAQIEEARRAGRVAIQVPGKAILRAVPPEPQRSGLRRPARFELPDGALEIYLSEEQFRSATGALGR
jgi:hypothetical protein